jgi:hypothetical protein
MRLARKCSRGAPFDANPVVSLPNHNKRSMRLSFDSRNKSEGWQLRTRAECVARFSPAPW